MARGNKEIGPGKLTFQYPRPVFREHVEAKVVAQRDGRRSLTRRPGDDIAIISEARREVASAVLEAARRALHEAHHGAAGLFQRRHLHDAVGARG